MLASVFKNSSDGEAALATVGGTTEDIWDDGGFRSSAEIAEDPRNIRELMKLELQNRKAFTNSFFQ